MDWPRYFIRFIEGLLCGAVLALILIGSFRVLVIALDMPVVYLSTRTGTCVRVERGGSCEDLPARHHQIWVP